MTLEQLELENDKALIAYWEANIALDAAKFAVDHTSEALVYCQCRIDYNLAQARMADARLAYLKAKVRATEGKGN